MAVYLSLQSKSYISLSSQTTVLGCTLSRRQKRCDQFFQAYQSACASDAVSPTQNSKWP